MKDFIEKIRENKGTYYLVIILIGILISIPFAWMQIKTTDDGWLHLIRLIGLEKSMTEGDFPFLVFPYLCRNFGYSMTAFYQPIVMYIPYVISFIAGSFTAGLKVFASATLILSGIFMYNFIHEVTKNKGISLLAAIIYMVFPYRFEDIYNRYAIGEFTSFVFIPIVFQGLYNLLHEDGKKHYFIAIGAIGLLLSHTISTVYTALFCLIYILFSIKRFLRKDIIIKCVINAIFIILVCSLFLIPMLEFENAAEYSIFQPNVMKTSGEYVQNNVIELWQLLKDKGEENGVSFIVGIPTIFMIAIGILVYKDIDKKYKDFYTISLILGAISIFMCTKFFPWRFMPNVLCTIQYPWRLIGFALFFFTPVCALNIYTLFDYIKKYWLKTGTYAVAIILLGILTASRLSIYTADDTTLDAKYEENLKQNLIISHFSVNRDYLPYNALKIQFTYLKEREDRVYILEGNAEIKNEKKNALNLEFEINNALKSTILELPYFYYPGYSVILEKGNENIKLDTFESNNGFLSIQIPENMQKGRVLVDYTGTTLEKIAFIISGISFIVFITYIIYFRCKNKEIEKNAEISK